MTASDEELDALIEAVEAGNEYIDRRIQDAFGGYRRSDNSRNVAGAYDGDLNAAKELHETLVPDYNFETFSLHGEVVLKRIKPIDRHYGWADLDPARAWLLAILKAYRTQVTQ